MNKEIMKVKISQYSRDQNTLKFDRNRLCIHCGMGYIAAEKRQKFCSLECEVMHTKGRCNVGNVKSCEFCGKEYISFKSSSKFCDVSCKLKSYAGFKIDDYKKVCPVCNVEFMSDHRQRIYCSMRCKNTNVYRKSKLKNQLLKRE